MSDPRFRDSFAPAPGCIIRTDYLSILRLVRDNPGINRTSVARALPCSPSTSSKKKRIDELVRFEIITEDEDGLSRRLNLTEKGDRILEAAERLIEEVYR